MTVVSKDPPVQLDLTAIKVPQDPLDLLDNPEIEVCPARRGQMAPTEPSVKLERLDQQALQDKKEPLEILDHRVSLVLLGPRARQEQLDLLVRRDPRDNKGHRAL